MSWLTRIFRGGDDEEAVDRPGCGHVNLTPRWDDPQDVGNEEKATGYSCIACGVTFTTEQAQALGRTPTA